jgi:beta-xylosidase
MMPPYPLTTRWLLIAVVPLLGLGGCGQAAPSGTNPPAPGPELGARNPIIKERFSSDPAALVHDGRVWLYTGHDEAEPGDNGFEMWEWHLYSSTDLVDWEHHGAPISVETFDWASRDAWASQAIERDGRFYFYATVRHATIDGFSIGVAVADRPEGPFEDARGSALITNDMTEAPMVRGREMDWDDIDPTVFIDHDGQAYLFWGNTVLHYARLNDNMTELDGPIVEVDVPDFTEAPWIHEYGGRYYLSYAYRFPEQIAYATADRITGPYEFQGVINGTVPESPTNHQSIIEYDGDWYFFYHNAALPGGGEFRRSVAVERMFYDAQGRIFPITQAENGLGVDPPAGAVE